MLADTDRAMELQTDGSYRPVRGKPQARRPQRAGEAAAGVHEPAATRLTAFPGQEGGPGSRRRCRSRARRLNAAACRGPSRSSREPTATPSMRSSIVSGRWRSLDQHDLDGRRPGEPASVESEGPLPRIRERFPRTAEHAVGTTTSIRLDLPPVIRTLIAISRRRRPRGPWAPRHVHGRPSSALRDLPTAPSNESRIWSTPTARPPARETRLTPGILRPDVLEAVRLFKLECAVGPRANREDDNRVGPPAGAVGGRRRSATWPAVRRLRWHAPVGFRRHEAVDRDRQRRRARAVFWQDEAAGQVGRYEVGVEIDARSAGTGRPE